MAFVRIILWLLTAGVFGLAAAWLGSPSAKQPLWTAEEPGVQSYSRFTSDGSAVVYFVMQFQVADQTWVFRAVRRDPRSGQVIGESKITVDPSQLEGSVPCLLGDHLIRLVVHNRREQRTVISLYDLETGNLVAGPTIADGATDVAIDGLGNFKGNDVADGAMDRQGRWFAQVLPGREQVRIVSFRDGKTTFEFDRPGFLVQEALAIQNGERVLIRWISSADKSEVIESRDVATGDRLAEAKMSSGPYSQHARSTLIGDRVYLFGDSMFSVDIGSENFGRERGEGTWKRNPHVVAFSNPPDFIAVRRNRGELRPWQLTVNGWCKSLGLREYFATGKYDPFVAVVDTRSGETVDEVPVKGSEISMSPTGDTLVHVDAGRSVVGWALRRTPDRPAFVCALMAAIGVVSLACWRSRRRRVPVSIQQPAS